MLLFFCRMMKRMRRLTTTAAKMMKATTKTRETPVQFSFYKLLYGKLPAHFFMEIKYARRITKHSTYDDLSYWTNSFALQCNFHARKRPNHCTASADVQQFLLRDKVSSAIAIYLKGEHNGGKWSTHFYLDLENVSGRRRQWSPSLCYRLPSLLQVNIADTDTREKSIYTFK